MQIKRTLEAILIAGTLAFGTGCEVSIPRVDSSVSTAYQANQTRDLNIILKENEYPVPNDVFDVYSSLFPDMPRGITPRATFIQSDDIQNIYKNRFRRKLAELGYNENDIRLFYTILSKPGNIVFIESLLENEHSLGLVIMHERFHKEMANLSREEWSEMINAYYGLLSIDNPVGSFLKTKERYTQSVLDMARNNFQEMYAGIATEIFNPNVEIIFRAKFPRAFEIFQRIKNKSVPKFHH